MEKMISHFNIFAAVLIICWIGGCSSDDTNLTGTGTLTLEFDNRAGNEDLQFGTEYINSSGEKFTLTKLNYYISNISLATTSGDVYTVPQDLSYFLVREDDAETREVTLENIPAGDYNKISFIIGVDSLRSTMDVSQRTGVLNVEDEDVMYWDANAGYVFLKMEGTSSVAPAEDDFKFTYHIGGYGGNSLATVTFNNIRKKIIDLGKAKALVRSNKTPEVHLYVNVLEFFSNPNTVSIADHPDVKFSEYSMTLADNFPAMFKFDHVHN